MIQGIGVLNGVGFKNRVSDWGLRVICSSLFEAGPALPDLYLAICGWRKTQEINPGTPNPYTSNPALDTLGYEIANFTPSWEWVNDPNTGLPIEAENPPFIDGSYRAFFEFIQASGSRPKLTPWTLLSDTTVTTDIVLQTQQVTFSCTGKELYGGSTGESLVFYLVDSPDFLDNNSKIFCKMVAIDWPSLLRTGRAPTTVSLGPNATFSYKFTLGERLRSA